MNQKKDPTCEAVRGIILGVAIGCVISTVFYVFTSDSNRIFNSFALSMLLLSAYGIMEHIKRYSK